MKESDLIKKAKTESIVKYGEVNDDFLDGVKFWLALKEDRVALGYRWEYL